MNQVTMIYKNTNSSLVNSIGSDGSCTSIVFNAEYQCVDCSSCQSEVCSLTQDSYGSTTSCTCFCSTNDPNCLIQQDTHTGSSQEATADTQRIVAIILLSLILVFGFFAIFIWLAVLSAREKNIMHIELEYIQVPDLEQKLPLHFMLKL